MSYLIFCRSAASLTEMMIYLKNPYRVSTNRISGERLSEIDLCLHRPPKTLENYLLRSWKEKAVGSMF